MLEQINSARNMGNANAALTRSNFAHADQIATEFLVQLIRLSSEDFKGPSSIQFLTRTPLFLWSTRLSRRLNSPNSTIPLPNTSQPFFKWSWTTCWSLLNLQRISRLPMLPTSTTFTRTTKRETVSKLVPLPPPLRIRKNPTFINTRTISSTTRLMKSQQVKNHHLDRSRKKKRRNR